MNKPEVIKTPTKYALQRSAASALPVAFFVLVCGVSGLLWKYQTRSEVLVGEVEVVEHLVASPGVGTVAQLIPSEGQMLETYVAVAKDQLLIQLDDGPVRSQLDAIERELISVSDEVVNELAQLRRRRPTTKIVAVVSDDSQTEVVAEDVGSTEEVVEESDASSAETESVETEAVEEVDAELGDDEVADESDAVEATDEVIPAEPTTTDELSSTEEDAANAESDVWLATQSLVDQSLTAVDVARRELDLRQFDTELMNAKSELIASGGDLNSLESFRQERRDANDAIFELKSELIEDRTASFEEIPREQLSATSQLVFRALKNRVKVAETQLSRVQLDAGRLDVISPVDGQIEETLVQLRQSVLAGQPLLTVIPQRGTIVVVYVREQSLFRPFAGMPVTLRSRSNVNQQVDAVVEAVGPKVEQIPERHRTNPKLVEWGRPMRIRVPEEWNVEPGSLLDVVLD